jgi:N-acetylmuramoyl-L-alanine amidase
VRIRRLLFLLAFILFGSATCAHAALGISPRCVLPALPQATMVALHVRLPIPKLERPVPNYNAEGRDYLIRTIVFEASGETRVGKIAVAQVVLNRTRSGRWGDTIKDVVTRPWQFEPWMTKRPEMERLSPADPRYEDAAQIADAVLSGQTPDPTAGATHFLNPVIVRQRRGGSLPKWAQGEGQPIGRHVFYQPHENAVPPTQVGVSMATLEDSPCADPGTRGRVTGRVLSPVAALD